MSDETEFLKQFDGPQLVGTASFNVYGQVKFFPVPALVLDAVKNDFIVATDEKGPIVTSEKVYLRELQLTDKGRLHAGLPPLHVERPKKKQAAKSLFD